MHSLLRCELEKEYIFLGFSKKSTYETHLLSLGLIKGTAIQVLSFATGQQLIVHFKKSRLGISQAVAETILVEEKDSRKIQEYITLNELPQNSESIIEGILGAGGTKRRLMDMGLTRGTSVYLRKVAPLGDPLEITVRGYELTLRKSEASLILIKDTRE